MAKMNDIIKLSVGAREFKTSRGTLMADQYSMLSKMTLQYREYGYPPLAKVENGALRPKARPRL